MTVMTPIDYKEILNQTFMQIGKWVAVRDAAEIEVAKLKQFFYATLNLIPENERFEFQKQIDELGKTTEEGLTEAIKSVLMAADGWMTTAMVRDKLKQIGFDFSKYGSNPLASIGTALRRWKPEEVESAQVEGVNAYRWKKREAGVSLLSMLNPALVGLGTSQYQRNPYRRGTNAYFEFEEKRREETERLTRESMEQAFGLSGTLPPPQPIEAKKK